MFTKNMLGFKNLNAPFSDGDLSQDLPTLRASGPYFAAIENDSFWRHAQKVYKKYENFNANTRIQFRKLQNTILNLKI